MRTISLLAASLLLVGLAACGTVQPKPSARPAGHAQKARPRQSAPSARPSQAAQASLTTKCKVGYVTLVGSRFRFTKYDSSGNSRAAFSVTATDSGKPMTLNGFTITSMLGGNVVNTQDTGPGIAAAGGDTLPFYITPGESATYWAIISELSGDKTISVSQYRQLTCSAAAQ